MRGESEGSSEDAARPADTSGGGGTPSSGIPTHAGPHGGPEGRTVDVHSVVVMGLSEASAWDLRRLEATTAER